MDCGENHLRAWLPFRIALRNGLQNGQFAPGVRCLQQPYRFKSYAIIEERFSKQILMHDRSEHHHSLTVAPPENLFFFDLRHEPNQHLAKLFKEIASKQISVLIHHSQQHRDGVFIRNPLCKRMKTSRYALFLPYRFLQRITRCRRAEQPGCDKRKQ